MIRFHFLAAVLLHPGYGLSSHLEHSITLPIAPTTLLKHDIETVYRKVLHTFSSIADSDDGSQINENFHLLLNETLQNTYKNISTLVTMLSVNDAIKKKIVHKMNESSSNLSIVTDVKSSLENKVCLGRKMDP